MHRFEVYPGKDYELNLFYHLTGGRIDNYEFVYSGLTDFFVEDWGEKCEEKDNKRYS